MKTRHGTYNVDCTKCKMCCYFEDWEEAKAVMHAHEDMNKGHVSILSKVVAE